MKFIEREHYMSFGTWAAIAIALMAGLIGGIAGANSKKKRWLFLL
ncbi:hypothetical protein [Alteribacter salitolerans]|nr:hypothetical protein [Alteribacter salitolerans]